MTPAGSADRPERYWPRVAAAALLLSASLLAFLAASSVLYRPGEHRALECAARAEIIARDLDTIPLAEERTRRLENLLHDLARSCDGDSSSYEVARGNLRDIAATNPADPDHSSARATVRFLAEDAAVPARGSVSLAVVWTLLVALVIAPLVAHQLTSPVVDGWRERGLHRRRPGRWPRWLWPPTVGWNDRWETSRAALRTDLLHNWANGVYKGALEQERVKYSHLEHGPWQRSLQDLDAFRASKAPYAGNTRSWPRVALRGMWNIIWLADHATDSNTGSGRSPALLRAAAREVRKHLRRLSRLDLEERALPRLVYLATLLGAFSLVAFITHGLLSAQGLSPRAFQDGALFVGAVLGFALAAAFVGLFLPPALLRFTERSWTDLDDVIVASLTGPTLGLLLLAGLAFSLTLVPLSAQYLGAQLLDGLAQNTVLEAAAIALLTWVATLTFNRVLIHRLQRWAERTKHTYDDMFVALLKVFGSFFLVAAGLGLMLVVIGPKLEPGAAQNLLLPYSIVVGVITAVLGYAGREAFANFFGGLLLQVDKPFEVGDRLQLDDGRVVEVREVGMRSTRLYDVLANTMLSMPNEVLTRLTITNVSLPDIELRFTLTSPLTAAQGIVRGAERILVALAYHHPYVDMVRLVDEEVPVVTSGSAGRRRSVKVELESIKNQLGASVATFRYETLKSGVSDSPNVFTAADVAIKRMCTARTTVINALNPTRTPKPPPRRHHTSEAPTQTLEEDLDELLEAYRDLSRAVFALRNCLRESGNDSTLTNVIVDELAKEPSCDSHYRPTSDGRAFVEIRLVAHSLQMEMASDVAHQLLMQFDEAVKDRGWAGTTTGADLSSGLQNGAPKTDGPTLLSEEDEE